MHWPPIDPAVVDPAAPKAAWRTTAYAVALGLWLASAPTAAETLYRLDGEGCQASLETDASGANLRVRADQDCPVSASRLQELLDQGLSLTAPPKGKQAYSSIFLGRLVHYPWLVSALLDVAAASPQWDSVHGAAKDGQDNRTVAQLLSQSEALLGVRASLRRAGYDLTGVSVEKVLVGGHTDFPYHLAQNTPGKLPFDAQVWLMVAP